MSCPKPVPMMTPGCMLTTHDLSPSLRHETTMHPPLWIDESLLGYCFVNEGLTHGSGDVPRGRALRGRGPGEELPARRREARRERGGGQQGDPVARGAGRDRA